MYHVAMQITFPIPEFAREERNLRCDVVHITTVWVSRLVLDHAISAIHTSHVSRREQVSGISDCLVG